MRELPAHYRAAMRTRTDYDFQSCVRVHIPCMRRYCPVHDVYLRWMPLGTNPHDIHDELRLPVPLRLCLNLLHPLPHLRAADVPDWLNSLCVYNRWMHQSLMRRCSLHDVHLPPMFHGLNADDVHHQQWMPLPLRMCGDDSDCFTHWPASLAAVRRDWLDRTNHLCGRKMQLLERLVL